MFPAHLRLSALLFLEIFRPLEAEINECSFKDKFYQQLMSDSDRRMIDLNTMSGSGGSVVSLLHCLRISCHKMTGRAG